MSEITDRLNGLLVKSTENNTTLETLLVKIRGIISENRRKCQSKIDKLTQDLQSEKETRTGNETSSNTRLSDLDEQLRIEKEKTVGIDTVLTQIEQAINETTTKLTAANNESFFVEEEPSTIGGKSRKRKRHNKKHSKNKSHRIRNKKNRTK